MKVSIPTQHFSDLMRRAIRHHYGEPGLATRKECRDWFTLYGQSADSDIVNELRLDEPEWEDEV